MTEIKKQSPLPRDSATHSSSGLPYSVEGEPPMRTYRGRTAAQPSRLAERMKIADQRPLLGGFMALSCSRAAKIMAGMGYDFIFIDWEHTPYSVRELTELVFLINAASEGNSAVIVRVPDHSHTYVAWALDAGASGIVFPHVETAEQARTLVGYSRFCKANHGQRSWPPFALLEGINDAAPPGQSFFDVSNEAALIMQIESKVGCNNAEEISAVQGVNGLMMGRGDLALDLDLDMDYEGNPIITACVDQVLEAAISCGIPLCDVVSGPEGLKKGLEDGLRMTIIDNDINNLINSLRTNLVTSRQILRDRIGRAASGDQSAQEDSA